MPRPLARGMGDRELSSGRYGCTWVLVLSIGTMESMREADFEWRKGLRVMEQDCL